MTRPATTRPLQSISTIVIHCADVRNGLAITADIIDRWHRDRNFRRAEANLSLQSPQLKHIGYHAVIELDGNIALGRHLIEIGAHVEGHNTNSVGVCMVGRDAFTHAQWAALRELVGHWQTQLPNASTICGHRDFNPRKTCPGFDVSAWLRNERSPLPKHLFTPSA